MSVHPQFDPPCQFGSARRASRLASRFLAGAVILPEREVGPARVTWAEDLNGPPLPGCIRSAHLRQNAPTSRDLGDILYGDHYRLHAHVRIEGQPAATDRLWLTLEEWNGSLHQTSWPCAEVMSDVVFPDQDQKK